MEENKNIQDHLPEKPGYLSTDIYIAEKSVYAPLKIVETEKRL